MAAADPLGPLGLSDAPSMPDEVVERLTVEMSTATSVLEYGAGGSSILAARLGVPHLVTVESDSVFLADVVERIGAIASPTIVHAEYVDIGPTGAWGRPIDQSGFVGWPQYALRGPQRVRALGLKPEFVLVDGRFRVACVMAATIALPAGTTILLDDYEGRSKYHVVEAVLGKPERVGRAAVFVVPPALDTWAATALLAAHCVRPAH